jgi:hypothetical protein
MATSTAEPTRTDDVHLRNLDLETQGVLGRAALSTAGIVAETLTMAKIAGRELIDVTDALVDSTLDASQTFARLAGPFETFAAAPVTVARNTWKTATTGAHRLLTLA